MQFSTKYISCRKTIHAGRRAAVFSTAAAFFFGIAPACLHAQSAVSAPLFQTRRPSYNQAGSTTQTFWVNQAGMVVPASYEVPASAPANNNAAVDAPAQPLPKPKITLDFTDVAVADLINVIAKQGNVGIIIGGDVTARLKSVQLHDVTPEEAIKIVAQQSGLSWTKINDNTFAVANRPADLPADNNTRNIDSVPSSTLVMPAVAPHRRQIAAPDDDADDDGADTKVNFQAPPLAPRQKRVVEEEPKEYARILVHNVSPHMMAYWLDPVHFPMPHEFSDGAEAQARVREQMTYPAIPAVDPQVSTALSSGTAYNPGAASQLGYWSPTGGAARAYAYNSGNYGNSANGLVETQRSPQFGNNLGGNRNGANGANGQTAVFDLPDGIDSLVAIDPQNVLLVYGTDEGVQKLQQIIGFLDHPLRQVEIESQFVTVQNTYSKAFGLDFSSANGPFQLNHQSGQSGAGQQPGGLQITLQRDNFQATINSLKSANHAKTVDAPRVLAINNIPAMISSQQMTPILLTSSTAGIGGQVAQSQNLFFLTTSINLSVTPTINNDGTITVVMQPQFQVQGEPFGNTGVPVVTTQFLSTVANIKDGDTIALGGLRIKNLSQGGQSIPILANIPILGKLFKSIQNSSDDSDLIIFLTARIQHRVEDPVPGT